MAGSSAHWLLSALSEACVCPEPGAGAPSAATDGAQGATLLLTDGAGGHPGFCAALCPLGQQLASAVLTTRPEAPSRLFTARPCAVRKHGSHFVRWFGMI